MDPISSFLLIFFLFYTDLKTIVRFPARGQFSFHISVVIKSFPYSFTLEFGRFDADCCAAVSGTQRAAGRHLVPLRPRGTWFPQSSLPPTTWFTCQVTLQTYTRKSPSVDLVLQDEVGVK